MTENVINIKKPLIGSYNLINIYLFLANLRSIMICNDNDYDNDAGLCCKQQQQFVVTIIINYTRHHNNKANQNAVYNNNHTFNI